MKLKTGSKTLESEEFREWRAGDYTYVRVRSTDKERNNELIANGAELMASYFSNTGVKTYNQYRLKKST